jgi:hypothetical protein
MGFSNVSGKQRVKRPGCETATQRKRRRYRTGDKETAQDIRVVKKQKGERANGDRLPEQLPKQKTATQKKLKALVKKNEDVKKLRRKDAAGEALDEQQRAKLDAGDDVLLELHTFLNAHPSEAAAFARDRDASAPKAVPAKPATKARAEVPPKVGAREKFLAKQRSDDERMQRRDADAAAKKRAFEKKALMDKKSSKPKKQKFKSGLSLS